MDAMTIYNTVKIRVAEKELREGRKLTYRTIAKETGLTTGALTAYFNQRVKRFDAPTLEAFCRFFGCQPGDLLIFSDAPPPTPKE